jgi:hypothetical protein
VCYNAGLWHRYFVKMFLGGVEPAEPKVPSLVHKRDRVEVPYTKEEMRERTAAYNVKKKIWDKTMKVTPTATKHASFTHVIRLYACVLLFLLE